MKKYTFGALALAATMSMSSCSDLLDQEPYGQFSAGQLTENDVDAFIASAYAGLESHFIGNNEAFSGPMTNWIIDVRSDDALKGGGGISMEGNLHQLEISNITSDNVSLLFKWKNNYWAITRVHQAMSAIKTFLPENDQKPLKGELQFLRAWFYFDLYHLFERFPYYDETAENPSAIRYDNMSRDEIFAAIVKDLEEAYSVLPETQSQPGRVSKYVAAAMLARVNAFESRWSEVEKWSDLVVKCGQYSLYENYLDMSKIDFNNTHESILALQTSSANDNMHICWSNLLNVTYSEGNQYGSGDDFFHASQNLVDAFRTDANGLPYLDNAPANDHVIGDYYGNVDPRLDCTVGRIGMPWRGLTYTEAWVRAADVYSGYSGKKWCVDPQDPRCLHTYPYHAPLNFIFIRYADILLLHAEALIEQNSNLNAAMREINEVRQKAQRTLAQSSTYSPVDINEMYADYKVGLYQSFPNQEYARKAVRMERRLELAMEGQRWFDLVRWGNVVETMNAYFQSEKQFETYYDDAQMSQDEIFWPVPYEEVNNANGLYQ